MSLLLVVALALPGGRTLLCRLVCSAASPFSDVSCSAFSVACGWALRTAFASPATLAEVTRRLRNDDAVIRHLAVKRPLAAAVRPLPDPTATTSAAATPSGDALDQVAREYLRDGAVASYELSDGLAYPL